MSSSVKVIVLVFSKKALLVCVSAAKHSTLESAAILMRDFVAILPASGPNPNWLNKDLNLGFRYKVLTVFRWKDSSTSMSTGFSWITTATTPFPLWLGKGFLCTLGSHWVSSRVPSHSFLFKSLRRVQKSLVACLT